ncbi:MAG: putative glycoside hydrolase [Patescibacteria group bacterium]
MKRRRLILKTHTHTAAFAVVSIGALFALHVAVANFTSISYSNPIAPAIKTPSANVVAVAPSPKVVHLPTPNAVKAIYMTSWVSGTPYWRAELVKFIETTELNSIVIDVKDYSGTVSFSTGSPTIANIGSEEIRVNDLREFIAELHQKNIYTIARITVFQDPVFSKARPSEGVQDARGGLWKDKNGLTYVDPASREFWEYIVEIARASESVGFDELNFDYIRYPSDGPVQYMTFPKSGASFVKADKLEEFFAYVNEHTNDLGVPISADLFGFVTEHTNDLNIGQVLERAAPHFDYISPMVYPSHYPPGHLGYKNPALYPYEVVKYAMDSGAARLVAASTTPLKLRPWLQDFDLGADYDAVMVRKQIQATYDAGLTSWMIWDPANRYTRGAFELEVQ